jgi:hypothetical protein
VAGPGNRLPHIQQETMPMEVHRVELREIERMRDMYRHEMNCQITHTIRSTHDRGGLTNT